MNSKAMSLKNTISGWNKLLKRRKCILPISENKLGALPQTIDNWESYEKNSCQ